jgi:hypothetical protein
MSLVYVITLSVARLVTPFHREPTAEGIRCMTVVEGIPGGQAKGWIDVWMP